MPLAIDELPKKLPHTPRTNPNVTGAVRKEEESSIDGGTRGDGPQYSCPSFLIPCIRSVPPMQLSQVPF